MSDQNLAELDPASQLFSQIAAVRTVLLGLDQGKDQMQPMTVLGADLGRFLIFTTKNTDVGQTAPSNAWFAVTGKNHDYHAFVRGRLMPQPDKALRDAVWNPVTSAWFPEGRDDPDLVMLEFVPETADIWASQGNPVVFGFKVVKANMTGEPPEGGVRRSIRFTSSSEGETAPEPAE